MFKKRFIFSGFIIFLIMNICNPLCNAGVVTNVYLKSNKVTVHTNEEFEISLNVENEKVAAYTANIYFDETKLELISGPEKSNVQNNRIIIVWYDVQGRDGELEKLQFRAKEEGVASFAITGEFYDKNGTEIQTNFENAEVRIENILESEVQNSSENLELENTNLEILAIENALLYPAFDNNTLNYKAEVSNEITKLNILAVPENEAGKVQIIGLENINEGNNKVSIIVTAANGITKKEYNVNVYKRNEQEEKEYEANQTENQKKLEQAYEIEKTSVIQEEEQKQEKQQENKLNVIPMILGVILIGLVTLVIVRKRLE